MKYFVSGMITYTVQIYVEHEVEADTKEGAMERARRHWVRKATELIEPEMAKYTSDDLQAVEDV